MAKDEITDVQSLIKALAKRKVNDEIKIVVKRGKESETLTVKLGRAPR